MTSVSVLQETMTVRISLTMRGERPATPAIYQGRVQRVEWPQSQGHYIVHLDPHRTIYLDPGKSLEEQGVCIVPADLADVAWIPAHVQGLTVSALSGRSSANAGRSCDSMIIRRRSPVLRAIGGTFSS